MVEGQKGSADQTPTASEAATEESRTYGVRGDGSPKTTPPGTGPQGK